MRGLLRAVLTAGILTMAAPSAASGQFLFDVAAAWGEEEHTLDVGGGYTWWHLTVAAGVAAVEHGLQPGLEWNEDRTKIFDTATGQQVDPVVGRTNPSMRLWARLEFQPDWWGAVAMWDPRNQGALGAFAGLPLVQGMEGLGEVRWVHTLGWLLAVRLRFQ